MRFFLKWTVSYPWVPWFSGNWLYGFIFGNIFYYKNRLFAMPNGTGSIFNAILPTSSILNIIWQKLNCKTLVTTNVNCKRPKIP
jgi:hypothetical protein